jgi:hypothetical protein
MNTAHSSCSHPHPLKSKRMFADANNVKATYIDRVPHNVTHQQSLANQNQTPHLPLRLTTEQSASILGKKLDKMNELLANISTELRVLISTSHAH